MNNLILGRGNPSQLVLLRDHLQLRVTTVLVVAGITTQTTDYDYALFIVSCFKGRRL